MTDFFENETAMISMVVTAATGLMTGPLFRMDPAAVGTITALVVAVFNVWVRFMVYSKKGAARVATEVATQAIGAVSGESAGTPGEVTAAGESAIQVAVDNVIGSNAQIKPPG